MRAEDWFSMINAPLNDYGERYGPKVLIWCDADETPWSAFYDPAYNWEDRDVGPAWLILDQDGPPIAPEDAKAWMPIAAPLFLPKDRP